MNNKKLLLVCSSGGHFLQLYTLKPFWSEFTRFWVTFRKEDTLSLLRSERVYFAFSPTNRNLKNFIRNLFMAFNILLKEKPSALIATGAGVGVPFIYAAKMFGVKTVYIESITRVKALSLSGRLMYLFVDEFIVQWPGLAEKYKKARFAGQVI